MPEHQNSNSVWNDFEPNELIPKSSVQRRAQELATDIDDWFPAYKQYMDPLNWEEVDTLYYRKKAFIEMSVYLLNAKGVGGENPLPGVRDLIVNRVNDRRFVHLLFRTPQELHQFYLPFVYAGYTDELDSKTESRLDEVIQQGDFWATERLQYRQQEYCFMFKLFSKLFGHSQDIYDEREALKNSLLDNQPNVVRGTLPDAYCLTHDVFFYRNYLGIFPDAFPTTPAPYDISNLLRGLILRYMAEENCDIVLELVLAGILQRQISRQLVQLVLSWVVEKVDKHGHVPGPDLEKTATENLPDIGDYSLGGLEDNENLWSYKNKHEEAWAENYHTNVVAGMTARFIVENWNDLPEASGNYSLMDRANRRNVSRLGQLLKSLADYDLKTGAQQMERLADTNIFTHFDSVSRDAIEFLENQQTLEGEFGYWTREEIIYTTSGNSSNDFKSQLVQPITDACRSALTALDTDP